MATRIGLTKTDLTLLDRASDADLSSALQLMHTVLKGTAYCLENLPGPNSQRAATLWERYQESVNTARSSHASLVRQDLHGQILCPVPHVRPAANKRTVIVDLADMRPHTGMTGAFPDPIRLAHKSSVNFTRQHKFQMVALAELQDLELNDEQRFGDGPTDTSVPEEISTF